jgi:hypothetical protein
MSLQAKSALQLAAEDPFTAHGLRSMRREPRPAAPFHKDVTEAAKSAFDRRTGQPIPVSWLRSLGSTLVRYHLHPEAKFWGGDYDQSGFLQRRRVIASTIQPIGKEADDLEEREFVGSYDAAIGYDLSPSDRARLIGLIRQAKNEFGLRALSAAAKVSHHQVSAAIAGSSVPDRLLIRVGKAADAIRKKDLDHAETDAVLLDNLARLIAIKGRNKVARVIGVDSSNLSKILKGERMLAERVRHRIANLLTT